MLPLAVSLYSTLTPSLASCGAGSISYKEFSVQLFAEENKATQDAAPPKSLTGKTCYKDNEWLKGSNGIFDGIFGGGTQNANAYAVSSPK